MRPGKTAQPPREPAPSLVAPAAAVAAATFLAFLPALSNGFVDWDDKPYLLENPGVRGLGLSHLKWMFTTILWGPYMPLTWLSFAVDYQLWGLDPLGYHLTSLLLHALNAAVFYVLARRLLERALAPPPQALALGAAFAALVFSLHPLRVESVAWAFERRDVLSGLFYLLSLLLYVGGSLRPSLACYALSLLSKGMGVSLPIILLILDAYPLRRKALKEKAPFFLLAGAAGLIGAIGQVRTPVAEAIVVDAAGRLARASYSLAFYLWKTLWPWPLLPLYEAPVILDPWEGRFLLSAATACALTAAAVLARKRWPAGLACWLGYAATLAPVLGLIPFGHQLAADRYSYLACLPWALLAGAGLVKLSRRDTTRAAALGGAVALCLATLTWRQTRVWRDTIRLWSHAVAFAPAMAIPQHNLGRALAQRGRFGEAIAHYRAALSVNPSYTIAYNSLGWALAARGELEAAEAAYGEALRLKPDYWEALSNLGLCLARQGRLEAAAARLEQAARLSPEVAGVRKNLGLVLHALGRKEDASRHLLEARRLSARAPDIK